MNAEYMTDIIRELKNELNQAKKKARALSAADEAQLYYNGVIVGLQQAIGKYEMWLYNRTPQPKAAARKTNEKNKAKKRETKQAEQCGGACVDAP